MKHQLLHIWKKGRRPLACSMLLLALWLNVPSVMAQRFKALPQTVTQPDGTALPLFVSGDSYYHWMHDEDNYTILLDNNGYYVYADLQHDDLVPTHHIAGRSSPAAAGLRPGLNYSTAYLNKLREEKGAYKARPSYVGSILEDRKSGDVNAKFSSTFLNALVIFVRFSGESEFTQSKALYDSDFNTGTTSLRNYYLWNSYNNLTITSTFLGGTASTIVSYQDSHPRSYFEPKTAANPNGYDATNRFTRERQLWLDAINALKSNIPASLDIDGNNDGWIDNFYFVIKGSKSATSDILWPHQYDLVSNTVTINGASPNAVVCVFETWHDSSLLSHETGHVLGAPDMYRGPDDTIEPLYIWDLMSETASPPQSMSAYTKLKYMGFISTIPTITESGYYTLSPLESSPSAYKIPSVKAGEYFVVEYRKKAASSFGSVLPGSGLVIYRINSAATGNISGPPDELYVYRQGGTNTTTDGNIFDAYYSADIGKTQFTDNTSPNGFMSDNSLGHLNISEIGPLGSTITFYYKKPWCMTTTVKNVTYTSSSSIPAFTEAIEYITHSGPLTITNGSNVTFSSGRVRLQPGFRASSGSYFRAVSPNCNTYQTVPSITRILAQTEIVVDNGHQWEELSSGDNGSAANGLQFDMYPNPAEDFLHLSLHKASEAAGYVEVYNASGQKVNHTPSGNNTGNVVIDLRNQPSGIYYLRVVSGKESLTKSFVIR